MKLLASQDIPDASHFIIAARQNFGPIGAEIHGPEPPS